MPLSAVFLIPPPALKDVSSSNILGHLALKFGATPLHDTPTHTPFTLKHELSVTTSSLLPGQASTRGYMQVLQLSASADIHYIGITQPNEPISLATVPTSGIEMYKAMMQAKMQALWRNRHTLTVTDGQAVRLKVPAGPIELRVGDLRADNNVFQGVLLEVTRTHTEGIPDEYSQADEALIQELARRLLEGLPISLDEEGVGSHLCYTETIVEPHPRHINQDKKTRALGLAEAYMEVLRK
ncbi:uncharacterized protein AB675_5013 [Cyphellophora attinorum]|uniref:Mediator of RNA polymerase II transcription subunit 20 n=1 Tax=Cyphellophora attinorum TaxID=1664694 RepID=A0A0N1HA38_9EURO|nr:uncharacterized protein AB675_5013 [Phialophora attinorum]KPI39304.1 hypothetical protein AB675_5013 [Phialophora attinorum]